MKNLDKKVIYIVGTGARKINFLPKAIQEFTLEGAEVYTIMSEMGESLADFKEFNIAGNSIVNGYSSEGEALPLEDLILVAPCTFNTLNKLANGIADTYPLTIIASAIGAKRRVILAPAMNIYLWQHPITKHSMAALQRWGCSIIYPELDQDRVTMAPIEKVADSVFHCLVGPRYDSENIEENDTYKNIVESNFSEFRAIGEEILDLGLTRDSAGCLSKRLPEGILVTSTGCQIGSLSKNELTLIKKIKGEKIYWQGQNKPSSEAPLLSEIYERFKTTQTIIHNHCPRITYNQKMIKYATQQYIRYGIFGQIDKLENSLRENNGFAILRLHGEITIGNSMMESLNKLKSQLEETHAR